LKPALPDLDRLLHERLRFAIVSALAAGGPRTFRELKEQLGTTDGNLSVHARRLEQAGFVDSRKSFVGRVPRTEYRLTAAGRRALARYLHQLETLIEKARAPSSAPPARSKRPREGPRGNGAVEKRSPSRGR
jgi:DNA-binding MarR family transcriptional regulator